MELFCFVTCYENAAFIAGLCFCFVCVALFSAFQVCGIQHGIAVEIASDYFVSWW